ncbi:MAG: hypothetical protein ACRD13_11320 [Terriglobales bacterium]
MNPERDLTAAALHRMSQPLTVLRGTAELALTRPLEVSQMWESLLTMARETERVVALAEALRALNTPPAAAPGAGAGTATYLAAELAPLAEAQGKRIALPSATLRLPPGWAGPVLTLASLALDRAQSCLSLRSERAGVGIADDGAGLDAAAWARCFDPFAAGADIAAALRAALARRQLEAWGATVGFGPEAGGGNQVRVAWQET